MNAAEQVLCIADKVRQGELPEISGVLRLGTIGAGLTYTQMADRLHELVAALAEQENVAAGDYNRHAYECMPHEQVVHIVESRVHEAVQALTGQDVVA